MHTKKKPILLFFGPVLIGFLLTAPILAAQPGSLQWHGLEQGMADAKSQNKKVLLYFWAEWCGYCVKMERETFSDGTVASYLNMHFIPIKVDSDRDRKAADLYNVRGLPTLWFLSETGEKIGNRTGFVDPEAFLDILRYMQTDSYKKMSLSKFLKEKS